MRLSINLPFRDKQGRLLDAAGIAERARMIEDAGFDGIWLGDHLNTGRPDPLVYLAIAASATRAIEIGTAVFIVPLRRPLDVAQRLITLQTLTPNRLTFGVGAGSASKEYEVSGLDFAERFRMLRADMATIRGCFTGAPGGLPGRAAGPSWGEEVGPPRFVLGAWHSERQLRRAAEEYDGWMSSAGGLTRIGGRKIMADAIKQYRDFGGRRALIGSVSIDLRAPTKPMADTDPYFLECSPQEAAARLNYAAELGYDDVILNKTDVSANPPRPGGYQYDFTMDELQEIRALVPRHSA